MKEAYESCSVSDVKEFLDVSCVEAIYPILEEGRLVVFREQMTGQPPV